MEDIATDSIHSNLKSLSQEDEELFTTSLEFFDVVKNCNPKGLQKVMISVKAILDKVIKSKKKSEKIKALKKEKIKAKKEAGDFIPEGEFKKQKEQKK